MTGHKESSRDGVEYSMLPSRGYSHQVSSFWHSVLFRHAFEDPHLESMFRIFTYKLQLARLRRILAFLVLWSTLMCVLHFVFESGVTLRNVCYVVLVILFVIVLLLLHTKYATDNRVNLLAILVLILCLCLCMTSFPINVSDNKSIRYTPADGVWQVLLTVFIIYTLMPLRIYVATAAGVAMCLGHTLTAIFLAEAYPWMLWRQITGNTLLFVCVHVLGVYVHDKTEHALRKVFHEACNCVSARIEAEEQHAKLDRLLRSLMPEEAAQALKGQLLHVERPESVSVQPYINAHNDVTIVHANLIGVTELAGQCTALELVHILNEILAKFDVLAKEKHCERIRVQGDVYSCMCGQSDLRNDHAKCCVDLSVHLIDFLREIREGTELELYTRIGVHTGHVTSGIVGNIRWSHDVYSQHVQTSREVMQACTPGKVLVSQATFEYLQGEYDVEPANVWGKSRYLHDRQMETFYIVPSPHRKSLGLFQCRDHTPLSTRERLSYRNMGRVVTSLVNGLRPRAEIPFAYIANSDTRYPGYGNTLDTKTSRLSEERDKLHRYLSHSVTSRTMHKSLGDWSNVVSLRFHHPVKEKRFCRQEDSSFPTAMLCALVQLVLLTALQATVLPRTLLLLLIFLTGFIWIACILILYLATKLRCVTWDVQKSLLVRMLLLVITLLFLYLLGQVNVLCCSGGVAHTPTRNNSAILALSEAAHLQCHVPQYIPLIGAASLLAAAIFFKMAAWIKLILLVPMIGGYLVVIEYTHAALFTEWDEMFHPDIPGRVESALALLLTGVLVYLQSRHAEWTLRLSFLWKDQAMEERVAVCEVQNQTRHVVMNMFPSHIALHFVDFTGFKHSLSTYAHSYQRVGLCCISIPNFLHHFMRRHANTEPPNQPNNHRKPPHGDINRERNSYIGNNSTERNNGDHNTEPNIHPGSHNPEPNRYTDRHNAELNKQPHKAQHNTYSYSDSEGDMNTNNHNNTFSGPDSFIVLCDIIKAFDQVLQEDRFSDLDKIRSSGPSYMVAIGLAPERPVKPSAESIGHSLTILVEFLEAVKDKLKAYNEDRRTHFQLRAGLSMGPLTAGVVGARQPYLDLWGYTVYLANLMEASGKPGCIQMTSELVAPLAPRYEFQRNSPIFLNGRGETCTHFLTGRKLLHIPDKAIYKHARRPDSWVKQSPFGTPIARFKQLPSDSSINTSGYITQPHTAERGHVSGKTGHVISQPGHLIGPGGHVTSQPGHVISHANHMTGQAVSSLRRSVGGSSEGSHDVTMRNARESPCTPSYGIRIQGIQRGRMASDDSTGKNTMTPPSSLHRRRNSGSLTGSERQAPAAHLLQVPASDPAQRVASPDLPMVHFQRVGGPAEVSAPVTMETSLTSGTHLTQSQILSQGTESRQLTPCSESPSNAHNKHAGLRSNQISTHSNHINSHSNHVKSNSSRNSSHGNQSAARASVTSAKRSSTQTPSSTRSSAETVRSVGELSPISSPYRVGPSPLTTTSSLETRSDAVHNIEEEVFATGSEIAEMDNILRELGCNSSSNSMSDASLKDKKHKLSGLPKHLPFSSSHIPKVLLHASAKVPTSKSNNEPASQPISEYENDDMSDVNTSRDVITTTSSLVQQATPLENIAPIEKPKYNLGPSKSLSSNLSTNSSNAHALNLPNTHQVSKKTTKEENIKSPEGDVLRLPYQRYRTGNEPLVQPDLSLIQINRKLRGDDSSSTSSGVCGVPKQRGGAAPRGGGEEDGEGDSREESPPPLPPPPSMEALFGRGYHFASPHHSNHHHSNNHNHHGNHNSRTNHHSNHHHHHAANPAHAQYLHQLHSGSAFRPVALGAPLGMRSRGRHVGPVRPVPALSRAARLGMSTMSSNTSDELPVQPLRRRHPMRANQKSENGKNQTSTQDTKSNSCKNPKPSPSRIPGPVKQNSTSSDKTETGNPSGSESEARAESTLDARAESKASSHLSRGTVTSHGGAGNGGGVKKRPPAPPFQIKRRQHQPVRRCRSLDYVPSDADDVISSSRDHSPTRDVTDDQWPITNLIKHHVIGDNISISSFESGSEMSRSDTNLNYDSSCNSAYESEYDNYRPGMASDEDYFVVEPVSDVDLELYDDINLEEVTVSDKYDIDMQDFLNMNSMNKKQVTEV